MENLYGIILQTEYDSRYDFRRYRSSNGKGKVKDVPR